tara:strand:+ start:3365 stop:4825 length:1461 start_codon:yes stop_codon:yes gene_type:complete
MIYDNLNSVELLEIASKEDGCVLTDSGVLVTYTGEHTGRSPNARSFVVDEITEDTVDWTRNNRMSWPQYIKLKNVFVKFMKKNNVYLQDVFAIRDPKYSIGFEIYTEFARHSQFVRNMFVTYDQIEDTPEDTESYTIYHFPSLMDKPTVVISVQDRTILISGTYYSGEIKKSAFSLINLLAPLRRSFLPMHCSVNVVEKDNNSTIFFGLSGTGKTTLSAHPGTTLVGDDEHLWTDDGITNIEGGCYAKTIDLSREQEPDIWAACHTHGTMLENVVLRDGKFDFEDASLTKNGRASYSTDIINNAHTAGYIKDHPKNIIMLTCDAFGVLPPVAKLTPDEAIHHFLLGYTAKVAGTESGVTEPEPTFSPCFGGPFMPLPPEQYGELLREKIKAHSVDCWLVNTGWTGGPYGKGHRIDLYITREIIQKIIDGSLSEAAYTEHLPTGLLIPAVQYIPIDVLYPHIGWNNKEEYHKQANRLMTMMKKALTK